MKFYDIKTKIDPEGKPISVGFPYFDGAYKVRLLDKKEFYWTTPPTPGLFGLDNFSAGSHDTITITEGELDAASLYQVLRSPCASVRSSSSACSDLGAVRSRLLEYKKIYLCFDNDAVGRSAIANVAKLFDHDRVYVVKLDTRKDANEYLQHGEDDILRNLWWNAKHYLPDDIKGSFSEFRTALQEVPKAGISYPFNSLTNMTYGIRTGEMVLVTGMEKIGKTEFMHALEYQLLQRTNDNVGAIFLEENLQRHLHALGGFEAKRPLHLPDSGASQVEITTAVEKAIGRDQRLYFYSHFGSNDPEVFLDRIRFLATACSCRYILFDNISMALSGLAEVDERRAFDRLTTQLEMMVKELGFGLIMVSHVNDSGKTRGSRYMTKACDINIRLTRDLLSLDPDERNTMHILVPYNRYCGKTGYCCSVQFDPATYSYTETQYDLQGKSPEELGRIYGYDTGASVSF
jgi:twinkle protein